MDKKYLKFQSLKPQKPDAKKEDKSDNRFLEAESGWGSLAREGLRYGAIPVRGVVAGVGQGAADTATILPELARYGVQKARGKKTQFGEWIPDVQGRIKKGIDYVTNDFAKPVTEGEEVADAGFTGLGSLYGIKGALTGLGKGIMSVPSAYKYLKNSPKAVKFSKGLDRAFALNKFNHGAAFGSPAALQIYENMPGDGEEETGWIPTAKNIGVGALGAIGGGLAAGRTIPFLGRSVWSPGKTIKRGIARRTGKILGHDPELFKALEDANLPISAGNTSKSSTSHLVNSIISKYGTDLSEAQIGSIAKTIGIDPGDLKLALTDLDYGLAKTGAENYSKNISENYNKLTQEWETAKDKLLKTNPKFSVKNTLDKIERNPRNVVDKKSDPSIARYKDNPIEEAHTELTKSVVLSKQKPKNFLDESTLRKQLEKQNYPQNMIDDIVEKAIAEEKQAYYASIKKEGLAPFRAIHLEMERLSDEMGKAYHSPKQQGQLKQAYKHLAELQEEIIDQSISPEGLKNAQEARKIYHDYVKPSGVGTEQKGTSVRQYAEKVMSKGLESDEQAFKYLFDGTKNSKPLEIVTKGLQGKDKQNFISAAVTHLGMSPQGEFSLNTLFRRFNKLSIGQQKILLSYLEPEKRALLIKQKRLLEQEFRNNARFANTSNTAINQHALKEKKNLIGNIVDVITLDKPRRGARSLVGQGLNWGATKVIKNNWTNPSFLKTVNEETIKRLNKKPIPWKTLYKPNNLRKGVAEASQKLKKGALDYQRHSSKDDNQD